MIEKEELAGLLPHRGKMLLLGGIQEYSLEDRSITASAFISEDCIFYDPALGGVGGWAGFEFMAQAASALSGLECRHRGEEPEPGFLLSVSSMQIALPVLKAGSVLDIRVREDCRMDKAYIYNGALFLENEKVSEAKFTVMNARQVIPPNQGMS